MTPEDYDARAVEPCRCAHVRLLHTDSTGRCSAARACTCLHFRPLPKEQDQ